ANMTLRQAAFLGKLLLRHISLLAGLTNLRAHIGRPPGTGPTWRGLWSGRPGCHWSGGPPSLTRLRNGSSGPWKRQRPRQSASWDHWGFVLNRLLRAGVRVLPSRATGPARRT